MDFERYILVLTQCYIFNFNSIISISFANSYFIEWLLNLSLLVKIIFVFITFSFLTLTISLIAITRQRRKVIRYEKINEKLQNKYQRLLLDYLLNPDERDRIKARIESSIYTDLRKDVFIEQITEISKTLSFDYEIIIKDLYLSLNLNNHSLKKAKSREYNIKAIAFKQISYMQLDEGKMYLEQGLRSKNKVLKTEAYIALMRFNPDDPLSFLDTVEYPVTEWERVIMYDTLQIQNIPVPEFSRWYNSNNESVIILALVMTRLFKQHNSTEYAVDLLKHVNPTIRFEAFKTIGQVRKDLAQLLLPEAYFTEELRIRKSILFEMSRYQSISLIPFFYKVLYFEKDEILQFNTIMAISNIGAEGKIFLQNILENDDYNSYNIIIKQALRGKE